LITDFLHEPGFFGTAANRAVDMTLVAMILMATLFTIGVVLARQKKYEAHRWFQTSGTIINVIFVTWMMFLPFAYEIAPDIPERLGERFYWVTTLHALVGIVGYTFGAFVTLRGNFGDRAWFPKALAFNNYKLFMRIAYGFYMTAAVLGVWVYFVWFVNNPNPPTFG
jgi:uncharacterized membrane protein YozB (DUF420 family)